MSGFFGLFSKKKLPEPAKSAKPQQARRSIVTNPFHAVAVSPGRNGACAAAMTCAGKRFLAMNAPTLPLRGCDAAQCQCRYVHYDDRRQDDGRRVSDGVTGIYQVWYEDERRGNSGRRDRDP